jgi:hypothetical protein
MEKLSKISSTRDWFTKFTSIVKEYIPFREVIIRARDKPWMTSTIRSAMRKRDRFLRKFRLTKSLTDWNKYKSQKNLTVGIVRKEKLLYFNKLNSTLSDPKLNTKNWWKVVKTVYGSKACAQIPPIKKGGIFISYPLKKGELFNNYVVTQSTLSSSNPAPEISGNFCDRSLTHVVANAVEV